MALGLLGVSAYIHVVYGYSSLEPIRPSFFSLASEKKLGRLGLRLWLLQLTTKNKVIILADCLVTLV